MARKRPTVPRARPPESARLRYFRYVRSVLDYWQRRQKEILDPRLPSLLAQADKDHDRTDSAAGDLAALFEPLTAAFGGWLPDPKQTPPQIIAIGKDTQRHQQKEWQRQVKAGIGIEVVLPEPWLDPVLAEWGGHNVSLIKTLQDRHLARVETQVLQAFRNGTRVADLRKTLQETWGYTKSHAYLIARDQTLKLNGQLAELRQRGLGLETYTWQTSQDERVRKRHSHLNGTRQKWSDPPIVDPKRGRREHPGGDYQCRCTAEPDFSDLLGEDAEADAADLRDRLEIQAAEKARLARVAASKKRRRKK